MKIAGIEIFKLELPVKGGPFRIASSDVSTLDTTLVKIIATNGQVGWGETCPVGATYAEEHAAGARAALLQMAPGLIGEEVLPLPIHRRMNELLAGHNYAKAAVDIAVYDLLGKHLEVSVSDLLGGALTDRVPSYYAVGLAEPDEAARIAQEKSKEGYPRLQLKVGNRPVEIDIEAIRKTWEVIRSTGTRFAVDANCNWTTRDALRASRECLDVPFTMEQPCKTIEDLRKIRPQMHHAIYMDESGLDLATAISAAGQGLVDGFAMKITRIGGLQPMAAFRDVCAAMNLPHTSDDSWGGDIIAAACTHVGATVRPSLNEGAWIAAPFIEGHYDGGNGLTIKDGHVERPTGPGLGINPDEALFGGPVASF
ncbi:L-alanine-DL-glutamate epimerase [Devosia crocina]|uniref:L-alanine-DL-glutamate epimerase n=1 Tax=Devosia crocina TaxID=429728 RepID=A0A1I7NW27_9HYPH|nr:mandelate racemase/muconate lactonizing enzyme family protein [Devosia crocina]SFV38876.1 L-alanine-DL-glutamate epimerase [Devosia crocina]